MSDLQIGLVVVGVFVVAGVYLFNWRQERIFRRNAEQAFAHEHEDVLLQSSPSDLAPQARVEPKLHAHAGPKSAETGLPPAEGQADPLIDYVVEVALREPNDGADVRRELLALSAEWRKPLLISGYDPASAEWRPAAAGKEFEGLRFALQLSNR